MHLALALAVAGSMVAACGCGRTEAVGGPDAADTAPPDDAEPCAQPNWWPDAVRSARLPVIVHYRGAVEAAMAEDVLALIEHAWDVEVGQLGFRPPPADDGACGPDGALDVFLWRGKEVCYVDVLAEIDATPHDDEQVYLVIDPWGPYGGARLATTVAHEFNHALQAADDWDDLPVAYEMTATFVEDEVHDADDSYLAEIIDFQAHPDWSIDRDDDYETWFMYGAALYLRYLRDRHFGGDAQWIGGVWRDLRSPLGSGEPDLEDALDALLAPRGTSFVASVPEFARWRYYTGARADGAHLEEAAAMAEPARAAQLDAAAGGQAAVEVMVLGSVYIDVAPRPGARVAVRLSDAAAEVRWVVQVVPGASGDGDVIAAATGAVEVDAAVARTIIVTALPRGADDPDDRTDDRFGARLTITPP